MAKKLKKLFAYDLDETLFEFEPERSARIFVVDKKTSKVLHTLTNREYGGYVLREDEDFSYEEFQDASIFHATATPINLMLDKMIKKIAKNNRVAIVTARSDFDDMYLFSRCLETHGIDTDSIDLMMSGNYRSCFDEAPRRKIEAFIDLYWQEKYDYVEFYDDQLRNLHALFSLKDFIADVTVKAFHVYKENDLVLIKEVFETDVLVA